MRDAAVNFDMCRILQRRRALCVPHHGVTQHGFLVGLCLKTAVNYLSKSEWPLACFRRYLITLLYLSTRKTDRIFNADDNITYNHSQLLPSSLCTANVD